MEDAQKKQAAACYAVGGWGLTVGAYVVAVYLSGGFRAARLNR